MNELAAIFSSCEWIILHTPHVHSNGQSRSAALCDTDFIFEMDEQSPDLTVPSSSNPNPSASNDHENEIRNGEVETAEEGHAEEREFENNQEATEVIDKADSGRYVPVRTDEEDLERQTNSPSGTDGPTSMQDKKLTASSGDNVHNNPSVGAGVNRRNSVKVRLTAQPLNLTRVKNTQPT